MHKHDELIRTSKKRLGVHILIIAVVGIAAWSLSQHPDFLLVEYAQDPKPGSSFMNAIESSGIEKTRSKGASWADYDNDGNLDLLIVGGTNGDKLYRNNSNGGFTEATRKAGLNTTGSVEGAFGDYDNDGCIDLYVSRSGPQASLYEPGDPDILYHSNCDGTFTDVTERAGIHNLFHAQGVAWADYNNDGYLDLYVANLGVLIDSEYRFEPNVLYRNNGDGTFTDATKEARVIGNARCSKVAGIEEWRRKDFVKKKLKLSFQPIWFDYNNDGQPDLFVATDNFLSPLYRNNGEGTFTDVTERAGLCRRGTGMGVTTGDYDNDRDLDIYVTNVRRNYLWQNNGDETFSEVSGKTGTADNGSLGWGTGFLDYDNDGDLDLYSVNGTVRGGIKSAPLIGTIKVDKLFKNNGNGTFAEAALKEGIYGNDAKEAAALGDYNNDGFIDIFVASSHLETKARPRLYRNRGGNNHWLTIQLVGTKSNRDGVGARITLKSQGRYQIREVVSGSSFLSQNSLWQTFGLGPASMAEEVEISWPSGIKQTLRNVKANQKIVVSEEE